MVFERAAAHEEVVYFSDATTGLRAIVAIYSTALGPALGGTRFFPYRAEDAALEDVLALSKAMAYKAACAGLPLGGGKAVIIGNATKDKSAALLEAYGRYLESLGGRYYTACDVGTTVADMAVIAHECRYVTGRPAADGGAGDSSVLTAFGVFQGMRAAASHVWGSSSLAGRRVGVAGVGKVGHALVGHLVADGAAVAVADIDAAALAAACVEYPSVTAVATDDLLDMELDVYSPCALGGALNAEAVKRLRASIVCGGANNQLASDDMDDTLHERGILYAPDYVVNAGGLIQVASEVLGYDDAQARKEVHEIYARTLHLFGVARSEGTPPGRAADLVAERRIADGGPVYVPTRSGGAS